MLDLAREKAAGRGVAAVRFEWGDALRLPYGDASFDAATVAFGARNLSDLDRGLSELRRVVRPGGRLVILEITQPTRPPLSAYFSSVSRAALLQSVKRCPAPHGLAERMATAGFPRVRYLVLAGGIITIHAGMDGA